MADVTRRQFLRHASIGAAAAGVVGSSGAAIFSAVSAGAATPGSTASGSAAPAAAAVPTSNATDYFAHVSDVASGTITVFHGTSAYTITDPGLAAAIARGAK